MTPKRRNRRPAPQPLVTGETLENWRSNPALVRHAQQDETFRRIVTVLTNERTSAISRVPLRAGQPTESYLFGIQQGYEAALTTLNLMSVGPDPAPTPPLAATYDSPEQSFDHLTQSISSNT